MSTDMNSPIAQNALTAESATPAPAPLHLANARLVLPGEVLLGTLSIENGVITGIREGDGVASGAIDCAGDYVLPGLVELHTDNLERHIEPRPEVDWPHLPALVAHDAELASTGITTVFDALRTGSIHSRQVGYGAYARKLADELLAARAAGHLRISHFLHLRAEICSETLLEELAAFGPEDRVGIVSLMDHTPGQRQFRDLAAHVERLLVLQDRFGALHARGVVTEAARLGAVLASHDDTTADHVATSAANGVGFAEFPTTLEAAQACRDEASP